MYIFPGYINIVILILHIQYIDILYNYCHWHWYWHWHWHLWVDESKTCGMVSKAWVSSTQFGSKGGEKGGEKSGKYLQNRIPLHLPFPITEGIKTLQWSSNTSSKEWKDCLLERREINSRQPREPRSEHIYLATQNHLACCIEQLSLWYSALSFTITVYK